MSQDIEPGRPCWRVLVHGAGLRDEESHADTWDQATEFVLNQLMARGPRVTRIELRMVDKP